MPSRERRWAARSRIVRRGEGVPSPHGRRCECICDRTLEGHESARKRGKTIGGADVADDAMLSMALHLRSQETSLCDMASPVRNAAQAR
ncbi:hypothetical protein WEB32_01140 [Streptomyces netropsis]|uniref:hypothetical protein n=1 Tax=Streptomyces netropsis TaxID=55404 RepID=UPI0030CDAEDC